jgi:hypothetical protein
MATLAVHEAMGMKVDREAVAGLVSRDLVSVTASIRFLISNALGPAATLGYVDGAT